MITFAWAAISRMAAYISSARDQTMAKPVPPPVAGCQSGETDHGLPGSSSRDVQQLVDFRDGPRTRRRECLEVEAHAPIISPSFLTGASSPSLEDR
jgi:hypothetical protein